MDSAEQFAANYFVRLKLRTERFSKKEMRAGKTPDYRVFNPSLVAYCEAKHVQYDEWLDNQLAETKALRIVGGSRPDPVFNRLTTHIHTAHKQFVAVNSAHDYPNILVFANSDRHCGFADLLGVLTGNFYGDGGVVEPIFTEFSDGRIKYEKMTIDAYVWWNDWQSIERPKIWFWQNSRHYSTVSVLLGSNTTKHRRL